jgi:hypothetical protein
MVGTRSDFVWTLAEPIDAALCSARDCPFLPPTSDAIRSLLRLLGAQGRGECRAYLKLNTELALFPEN